MNPTGTSCWGAAKDRNPRNHLARIPSPVPPRVAPLRPTDPEAAPEAKAEGEGAEDEGRRERQEGPRRPLRLRRHRDGLGGGGEYRGKGV